MARGFLPLPVSLDLPPPEFGQPLICFLRDGIGDKWPQHRSKFEAVAAATSRDAQPGDFGVLVNPEMFIQRVAVKAATSVNNGVSSQGREGGCQKKAQVLFIFFGDDALVSAWMHLLADAMIRDLDHFFAWMEGEAIPTAVGNICRENNEVGGSE